MSRISLVEETRTDEKLALLAIAASRIHVSTTVDSDGQEALDKLPGYADGPLLRLVLLDLDLPRVSELEVLRHVRADTRTKNVAIRLTSRVPDAWQSLA